MMFINEDSNDIQGKFLSLVMMKSFTFCF